jgi:hypothetical protein
VGLDRLANGGAASRASLNADLALKSRIDKSLTMLVNDGGIESAALLTLLVALQSETPAILVIDMLEQGLDAATQETLIASLRRRGPNARPLFILTLSSAILDLDHVGADYPMSCQSQSAEPSRALSRVSWLRSRCHMPRLA